jgi:hypothetical protein
VVSPKPQGDCNSPGHKDTKATVLEGVADTLGFHIVREKTAIYTDPSSSLSNFGRVFLKFMKNIRTTPHLQFLKLKVVNQVTK